MTLYRNHTATTVYRLNIVCRLPCVCVAPGPRPRDGTRPPTRLPRPRTVDRVTLCSLIVHCTVLGTTVCVLGSYIRKYLNWVIYYADYIVYRLSYIVIDCIPRLFVPQPRGTMNSALGAPGVCCAAHIAQTVDHEMKSGDGRKTECLAE